ncbi:hypothetical protein X777_01223 [Ooceraea biroi]|uniref:Uncharacterized protein n=1 Tax=Ooceraea biroi TaxID=2015173 RepID=A0A026WRF4_OOCBI|nr:hypothetical protein X777_01223 [Ooceraea biroi]
MTNFRKHKNLSFACQKARARDLQRELSSPGMPARTMSRDVLLESNLQSLLRVEYAVPFNAILSTSTLHAMSFKAILTQCGL